jgi:hypothetical protein
MIASRGKIGAHVGVSLRSARLCEHVASAHAWSALLAAAPAS